MNAQTINQTFDLVAYVSKIVPLRKGGEMWTSTNGCPMCGGKDRFQIKRTQTGDIWHCRHCASGKYHSAIDFMMAYRHLDFKQAFELMGGDIYAHRAIATQKVEPLPEWASKFIAAMQTALIVRGARPEALEGGLEPRQDEWELLMAEMDERIQAQQEQERQWICRQAEGELSES